MRRAAIQQAVSAKMQCTTVQEDLLAQKPTCGFGVTCTTPSKDWPHPQHGRVNMSLAKSRTTRRVCSMDELSFVPRCFPHTIACRSHGRLHTEIALLWTSAVDSHGKTTTRMLRTRHDIHSVVAMCIALPPLIEPSLPMGFEHRERHCIPKAAEDPTFARFVESCIR
jgi:hypothetical protein